MRGSVPEDRIKGRLADLRKIADGLKHFAGHEPVVAWVSSVLNLALVLLQPDDPRVKALEKAVADLRDSVRFGSMPKAVTMMVDGLLRGLQADFDAGVLGDLRTQIRRDVEADLLDQAGRLLDEGFKDAAAMLTGAVLEDSLRQLCRKHGVPEGKNIESMNSPLQKANVYDLTQQKLVTAWAGTRNDADHGHFAKYSEARVRNMRDGVLNFVATYLK